MLLSVWHSTVYRYETEVARSTQYIRLSPAQSVRQRIVDWRVELPVPAVTMTDAFDNLTHVLTLDAPHQEIRLLARGRVEVDESDDGEPAGRINPRVFLRATPLTEPDEAIRAFVAPQRGLVRSRPMMGVTDLMHALIERMPYEKGHTSVESTAAQSFAAGRGACQDHAHPFVACRPAPGAPARYVSGYVYTPDREQVASHAWAEAWLTNRWVSFDVSNAGKTGEAHLKLAVGLDYLDACPVRGVRLGGGEEALHTAARVEAQAPGAAGGAASQTQS
ncbi:MAG TPA: transglutaminase family protein, partial [Burkholderiaceae bacterium]|nr:transglutaminase family protein [Burkholderiaceae bacterium]